MGRNKKNRGIIERMRKHPKLLIAMLLLSATTVYGIWSIVTQDGYTAYVISEGTPLSFSMGFDDLNINTSVESVTDYSVAVLQNTNGLLTATVGLSVDKSDLVDGCIDYENDCDVVTTYDDIEIQDNDVVNISSGSHTINSTVSCAQLSCPQNVSVDLSFTT